MNKTSEGPTLSIYLLGDFRLVYGSKPVTGVDSARLQSLLAYLLLHRDAPQARHYLAFLFWPDSTEAQARTNLRNLVHLLRRALPDADRFLHIERQTLQWRAETPFTLDVADFERAVAQAEQAEDQAAIQAALEEAVALYRGDLLPSCYDDWIYSERERLQQACIEALEQLIGLLEDQRDYRGAISHAQRLLRHDPLHEETYRRLMRLHALSGDRAGALRTYHTSVTVLRRELDVEPSPETREAYERLLETETLPEPSPIPPAGPVPISPLVGRHQEWAQLQAAWGVASAGRPHFVLVRGEAGTGNTRLAEELLQWADRQGIATASARCYAAEGGLAYAPVVTWLRARPLPSLEPVWRSEIARLLPELLVEQPDLSPPGPLTETWQRQRLFEALARALLGGDQPLMLLIDALQWCDRETLEWLHYLLRFDAQARLLVIGTCRTEELGDDHPLASLLRALRDDEQLTEIELGPLEEAATASLAANVAGRELEPNLATCLYQETEGNPLFVVETVRAGLPAEVQESETGELICIPRPLPPRVQDALAARLAQLSTPARELAGVAATIGREFTFAVLARASDRDEDALVRALDELWQRRIVREHGADAYDFSHDKLREVAYAGLSAARQRLLHRRVAQALEAVYADDLDSVSGQVAAHYERADQPQQAIPRYQQAAEVARQVYANEEAIAYCQRALTLFEAIPPDESQQDGWREVAAQLHECLGDLLKRTGRHDEARGAYQRALSYISEQHPIWQAGLHRKIGNTWREQGQSEEALSAYGLAETVLRPEPTEPAPKWWREWLDIQFDRAWVYYWLAQWPEIRDVVERTRPAVERYGTATHRAKFLQGLVTMAFRRDDFVVSEETLGYCRDALAASQESGDLARIAFDEFGLSFCQMWYGNLDEAEEHMQAALELAERTGSAMLEMQCLVHLAIVHRLRGQTEEVRSYVARSLAASAAEQIPVHVGTAKANLAWVAWREKNLSEARDNGQAALELWRQQALVYPFQWTALWPLIGVALAQDQISEGLGYARALLDPMQQRLPEAPTAALERAVQAGEQGQPETARAYLDEAAELAQEMGYL